MPASDRLRSIKRLDQLVAYLRDELDWPIESDDVEDISFSYEPEELGLDAAHAARINQIKQLRPLHSGQPWGIFWVSFEKRKLPVVVLRRILASLVVKSRQSANNADRPRWQLCDLLFISAYGDEATDQREIAFAHFHQGAGDLPTLQVLGWDGADTPLKLDHVAHTLDARLRWPANPKDVDAWRGQWSGAFRHRLGHVIRTADILAETLAALARGIRDRCTVLMRAESDRGPLTKLFKAFQAALIHDLTPEAFADTYAQTITFGLLTAAMTRTEMSAGTAGTFVQAANITDMVPVTNPFLKEMLQTFLKAGGRKGGIDFDELGIQDVVELLRGDETDLPAILRDFGNRNPDEDPVIRFYEDFLAAYDKPQKKQRGVFYTPQPVVSYIVRSVHELLQTEFGLADGLASTVTWGEMIRRATAVPPGAAPHPTDAARGSPSPPAAGGEGRGEVGQSAVHNPQLRLPPLSDEPGDTRTISPDEPFVQILDPATGTATFLVEVIDVIHRHLEAKWKTGGLAAMPALPAPGASGPHGASVAASSGHGGAVPAICRGVSESASDTPGSRAQTKTHPGGVPETHAPRTPLAPLRGAALSATGSGGVAGAQPPANGLQPSGLPGAAPRTFADYWNLYVPAALLPRLHAFELMMAPYAIAHMKIGLKLAETGYRFGTEERARIYLTNALEPKVKQLPQIGFDALAHEAAAVNEIKWYKRFTVVIGNPPYAGISSNMTEQAQRIVDAYRTVDGAALNEKKIWLQDDYVKFTRKAQTTIEAARVGVLGFITNHGYLDNPTFRGMRQSLMGTFRRIRVLDLHGNANKKEQSPDGSEDKNVFDIRQGVAVCLASRDDAKAAIAHADLWGTREEKYAWLSK